MAALKWDQEGQKIIEAGVDRGVLYVYNPDSENLDSKYCPGEAWNGLTSVSESPSGADSNKQYADNTIYANLRGTEEFGGTIECFTFPDGFYECNGMTEIATGVYAGQQNRKTFGLAFQTQKGNDTEGNDHAYILHLVYGAIASPSEKGYKTINDSPEAIEFSYAFKTTPTNVAGGQPTSLVEIDSDLIDPDKLAIIEKNLFGHDADPDVTGDVDITAHLLTPNQIADILNSQG